jgi:serine/threonine protein kinase
LSVPSLQARQADEGSFDVAGRQRQTNFLDKGAIFEGKYRIVRELGRGGFGMVYLAYQEQMDRHVAIKVLKSGIGELHRSAKERFLREVKIISKLRHPNTVTIHDFGETANGLLYMVLEFIEGETVKQILKREGAQPAQRALALTGQIARSLAEAHRHGVIHRDLKPANIMIMDLETEKDFVKVLDFGIARLLRTDERDLTSVGLPEGERELIGTPRYMSPEQVRGESLGPASDVYSVGLILYEMLVGQPAVQGDTTMALISQQISPEPLRLDGLRALPPQVSQIIRRSTSKNLSRRFPDAETFGDAVDQALASVGGPPVGTASARQSGRFNVVDRSGQFNNQNTPQPAYQTGRFGAQPGPNGGGGQQHGGMQPSGMQQMGAPFGGGISENAETNPTQAALPQHQQQQQQHFGQPSQPAQQQPSDHGRAGPFTGNAIHEYIEDDELDEDLPPPPSDTNQFAVPNPSARSAEKPTSNRADARDEETTIFVLEFLRLAIFGLVAAVGLYVAFLVVSTIFGHFLSGQLKLIASLILAAAIPVLTALGENSKRERFEVVENPYDRIVRVFVGTAIFSFGTAVICALAMSGAVVYELRQFPNWFMTDSQRHSAFGEFNAKVSLGLAQVVEEATSAIGIYEGKTHADTTASPKRMKPTIAEPPAPTRPSTQAKQRKQQQKAQEAEPAQDKRTGTRPTTSPSSDSKAPSKSKDDEYIEW